MSAEPTEAQEAAEEPLEAPEQAPEEQAPTEETVVQPADVVDDEEIGKVVELRSERGSLTLRPGQTKLDDNQIAALVAIGIDTVADPGIVPHVRAFVHMCQVRGLDPWAREAYLIGRGRGDNRKYTMQTGIDGYRKMAASTGRFIRVKKVLWTGQEDDDRSYRQVVDEDGDLVMQRVWFDQWPDSRGNPGAAKVVIEHYDEDNNVVTTAAIANWGMFAGMKDLYRSNQKVYDNGKVVQVPNDMWSKGGPHMLAKCAEALAHRQAFPATMSGFYITEEMSRLDQQERDRLADEKRAKRQEAYAAAHAPKGDRGAPVPVGEVVAEVVGDARQSAPNAPQDAPQDAPDSAPADEETRAALARRELDWIGEVLDKSPAKLAERPIRALRKNLDDFTSEELVKTSSGYRKMVVSRLSGDEAARYAELVEAGGVIDVDADVLGIVDAEVSEDADPAAPEGTVDPTQPHPFLDEMGLCRWCGEEEQQILHLDPAS